MKTLRNLVKEAYGDRALEPNEKRFVKKHVVGKFLETPDGKDYAGNDIKGAPYKATNVQYARFPGHGYDSKTDKVVYEEFDENARKTYDDHHGNAIKHLMRIVKHLQTHKNQLAKRSDDPDWAVRHPHEAMKNHSRRIEDLADEICDHLTTETMQTRLSGLDGKHQMGGTKYSNIKTRVDK